jgi:hypothetical protein
MKVVHNGEHLLRHQPVHLTLHCVEPSNLPSGISVAAPLFTILANDAAAHRSNGHMMCPANL